MPGHRRISTDLYLDLVDRKKPRTKPEALIELNLDDHAGSRKSVRSYARIWKWSREKVAILISLYEAHIEDLKNADSRGSSPGQRPATYRPQTGRPTGHNEGHKTSEETGMLGGQPTGQPATQPATNRPLSLPETGHNLEPNRTGGEGAPPRPPSASVSKAQGRERSVAQLIARMVDARKPEPVEVREEWIARYWILARMHLACERIPTRARLDADCRDTRETPTKFLEAACDEARRKNERGFPPSASELQTAGRDVVAKARKKWAQGEK